MIKINLKIITVALLSAFLSSCGGGVDVASNGDGITGTGITAGRVTGFGSIYVNGIKFDVGSATFSRDGVASSEGEYSLGEYIVIKGSVNGTVGTAEEVVFKDLLEGAVTRIIDDVQIEILGQLVEIDSNTTLLDDRDGSTVDTFPNLTDLAVGNIVEVSGVRGANDLIKATSIKLKEDSFVLNESENEIKGRVSGPNTINKTFMIGGILVEYNVNTSFDGLTEQDLINEPFVEVKSTTEIVGNILFASKIELEDEHLNVETNDEVEIEGLVTSFGSIQGVDVFYLNGIPVSTNSETIYDPVTANASDIILNAEIEVKGKVNGDGVLVAEEIEFED